jgi:hypothetical protein
MAFAVNVFMSNVLPIVFAAAFKGSVSERDLPLGSGATEFEGVR